ncbi:hypothetical protein ABIB83_008445 [Bradyrhizobium sp. I1.8.5]
MGSKRLRCWHSKRSINDRARHRRARNAHPLCDPLPSLPWTPPSIPACSDVPDGIRLAVCRNWIRSFILNPSRPKRSSAYYGPAGNCKGFLRISVHVCGCFVSGDHGERQGLVQPAQPGRRIIYLKVDADTGDDVPNDDIVKGSELHKGQFIELTHEELEDIALESTRTIEIGQFDDRSDIDPRYLIRLGRPLAPPEMRSKHNISKISRTSKQQAYARSRQAHRRPEAGGQADRAEGASARREGR